MKPRSALSYRNRILVPFLFVLASCGQGERQKGWFVDGRDGTVYAFGRFGDDVWMTENLRYKTDSCFTPHFVQKEYGFSYTADEACSVCPDGWRLPTEEDYFNLFVALGANKDSLKQIYNDPELGRAKIPEKLILPQAWGITTGSIMPSGWNALPSGGVNYASSIWAKERESFFELYAEGRSELGYEAGFFFTPRRAMFLHSHYYLY